MYGKTFTSLWEGSMVGLADAQLVFIFLFCHCDRGGFVEAHPAIVAVKTGLPQARVDAALQFLQEPDPNSRSKAEGGRRIVRIDDDHIVGWQVVNYEYYRGLRQADDRRAYHREYWHTRKDRVKRTQRRSTAHNPTQPIAEAEAEAEAEAKAEAVVEVGRSSSLRSSSRRVHTAAARPGVSLPKHDPGSFERFWAAYPRKAARKAACRAWDALKPDRDLLFEMSAGLKRYAEEVLGRPPDKIAHPATWLNGERWRDESTAGRRDKGATLQELGRRMKEAERGAG